MHILGFVVHEMLSRVARQFPTGSLDYCIDALMDVLMHDIFGGVADEKQVTKIQSKMKVRRYCPYCCMSEVPLIHSFIFYLSIFCPRERVGSQEDCVV